MIATIASLALCVPVQTAVPLIPEAKFVNQLRLVSTDGAQLATALSASDEMAVPQGKLLLQAREFSNSWIQKSLRPSQVAAASRAVWQGRIGADGVSKQFVKSWASRQGRITWIDNGVLVLVHVHRPAKRKLNSASEANRLIEATLGGVLALPALPPSKVKSYVASGTRSRGIWEGNILRDVRLGPSRRLSDGSLAEVVLDSHFKWHQHLYAAADGQNVVVRFDLTESGTEVIARVSDSRTRF